MISDKPLMKSPGSVVRPTNRSRPAFFDPATLPWRPWVMAGTDYKLLNIDKKTGGFTILLKVDPGTEAPAHGHLGAVEGYVVDGEFGYGTEDRGGAGSYFYEEAGIIHEPTSPRGTIMFAIANGPLTGFNDDGSVAIIVDAKFMYELAASHGVANHLLEGY
jgi:anti-sigma factor ChrR (cupin superfamily)